MKDILMIPGFLDWMHWTPPSAVFFIGLLLAIVGMTLWDIRSPSLARSGFLPIPTTRGDRFFIGLISALGLHLIWMALFGLAWIGVASGLSVLCFIVIGRWG